MLTEQTKCPGGHQFFFYETKMPKYITLVVGPKGYRDHVHPGTLCRKYQDQFVYVRARHQSDLSIVPFAVVGLSLDVSLLEERPASKLI